MSRNRRAARLLGGILLALLAGSASAVRPAGDTDDDVDVDAQADGASQQFFYQRRALPDGSFPTNARALGLQSLRRLGVSPMQKHARTGYSTLGVGVSQTITVPWAFVGPQPSMESIYSWGATSARINAIAVLPTNSNTLYIGTAWGGVAKSRVLAGEMTSSIPPSSSTVGTRSS